MRGENLNAAGRAVLPVKALLEVVQRAEVVRCSPEEIRGVGQGVVQEKNVEGDKHLHLHLAGVVVVLVSQTRGNGRARAKARVNPPRGEEVAQGQASLNARWTSL